MYRVFLISDEKRNTTHSKSFNLVRGHYDELSSSWIGSCLQHSTEIAFSKILRGSRNSKVEPWNLIINSRKHRVSRIKFQVETFFIFYFFNLHMTGTVGSDNWHYWPRHPPKISQYVSWAPVNIQLIYCRAIGWMSVGCWSSILQYIGRYVCQLCAGQVRAGILTNTRPRVPCQRNTIINKIPCRWF